MSFLSEEMIKHKTFYVDNVNLSVRRWFCQKIQYKIGHYDHFHSSKNARVEYQMSNNRLVLSFVLDIKPSCHDVNVNCRLMEEKFHLCKHRIKIVGWSKDFAVDVKRNKVDLLFANCNRKSWDFDNC